MDIKDVIDRKKQLERSLRAIIHDEAKKFKNDTDISISNISVYFNEHHSLGFEPEIILTGVEVKLNI